MQRPKPIPTPPPIHLNYPKQKAPQKPQLIIVEGNTHKNETTSSKIKGVANKIELDENGEENVDSRNFIMKIEVPQPKAKSTPTPTHIPIATPIPTPTVPPPLVVLEPFPINEIILGENTNALQDAGVGISVNFFLDEIELSIIAGLITSQITLYSANFSDQEGDLTIFVPNNDAFNDEQIALELSTAQLAQNKPLMDTILLYHIVYGTCLLSTDIQGTLEAYTQASGQAPITIVGGDQGVKIVDQTGEPANVVVADVVYKNVIFHVIDKVLIPNIPLI